MKRAVARRTLPAATAVLALALAAGALSSCNADWSPYAAKVGAATITQSTLDSYLTSISADRGYSCLISGGHSLEGVGTSTYQTSFVGFVLTQLIRARLVEQAASRRHLPEPANAYPIAEAQLQQSIAQTLSQDPACGSATRLWSRLSGAFRDELVSYQVAEDALAAAAEGTSLRPSDLAAYAASHPADSRQDCISVIEVKTAGEAAALRRAILGGASFAAEARRHSIDTSSAAAGGAIGCVTPSQLVQPLGPLVSRLTVGRMSSPVGFQSDWLLLLVTSRRPLSRAELTAGLFSAAQRSFTAVLHAALRTTSVAVDPLYGTWSTAPATFGEVRPPKAPATRFVPNPSVLQVSSSPSSSPVPAPSTRPGG